MVNGMMEYNLINNNIRIVFPVFEWIAFIIDVIYFCLRNSGQKKKTEMKSATSNRILTIKDANLSDKKVHQQ